MQLPAALSGLPPELGENLREIDTALACWVLQRSGSVELARIALLLSIADGMGQAELLLDTDSRIADWNLTVEIPRELPHWLGDGSRPTAFVIAGGNRLQFWRHFADARAIDAAIRARLSQTAGHLDLAALCADVHTLFGHDTDPRSLRQRIAVLAAPANPLLLLCGGPGTGKTSTVLRLLLACMALQTRTQPSRPLRVGLAAPTGMAAKRLKSALVVGAQALRGALQSAGADAADLLDALSKVATLQPCTLHSLLEYQPWREGFARDANRPLALDLLVVDECSMLDLRLGRALLEATAQDCALVMVGDPDQLAAVGTGEVFATLVGAAGESRMLTAARAAAIDAPVPDADTVNSDWDGHRVLLDHVWRSGGALQALPAAVRAGDAEALQACLRAAAEPDSPIGLHPATDERSLHAALTRWLSDSGLLAFLDALHLGRLDAQSALEGWSRWQILCALREGPFGVAGVNALIARLLAQRWRLPHHTRHFAGRAVLVTRNDARLGLFNGDVGLCLRQRERIEVWFAATSPGDPPRAFNPRSLPDHESAFALTVHKAQGSEFDQVALVLPGVDEHPLATRRWLYTGLTRARSRIDLFGNLAAIDTALRRA